MRYSKVVLLVFLAAILNLAAGRVFGRSQDPPPEQQKEQAQAQAAQPVREDIPVELRGYFWPPGIFPDLKGPKDQEGRPIYDMIGYELWYEVAGQHAVHRIPLKTMEDYVEWIGPTVMNGKEIYDKPIHGILNEKGYSPQALYERAKAHVGISMLWLSAAEIGAYSWSTFSIDGGKHIYVTDRPVRGVWTGIQPIIRQEFPGKEPLDTFMSCRNTSGPMKGLRISVNEQGEKPKASSPEPKPIMAQCRVSAQRAVTNEQVIFTAEVIAGKPDFQYSWEGDVSGSGQTVRSSFSEPGGKFATAHVTDSEGNKATCTALVQVEAPPPPPQVQAPEFQVSCSANPRAVKPKEPVLFLAQVSGGYPPFAYTWKGAVTGLQKSVTTTFGNIGPFLADLLVTDSKGQRGEASCIAQVEAPAQPIQVPSAAPQGQDQKQEVNVYVDKNGVLVKETGLVTGACPTVRVPFHASAWSRLPTGIFINAGNLIRGLGSAGTSFGTSYGLSQLYAASASSALHYAALSTGYGGAAYAFLNFLNPVKDRAKVIVADKEVVKTLKRGKDVKFDGGHAVWDKKQGVQVFTSNGRGGEMLCGSFAPGSATNMSTVAVAAAPVASGPVKPPWTAPANVNRPGSAAASQTVQAMESGGISQSIAPAANLGAKVQPKAEQTDLAQLLWEILQRQKK